MRYILSFFFVVNTTIFFAQSPLITIDSVSQKKWVDSVYNSMTLKEKIGQLFMVQIFSDEKKMNKEKIRRLIEDQKIGGIIFSKGGPVRQAKLNNELQKLSKTPLLIGIDAEWGLSMRLDSTYAFPWNMTLGAIRDLDLIKKTGKHIGEHCKRLGIHINFAPVVDINTNPNNPIIGNRSFGEDKINVTEKSLAYMIGLQNAGILASAKHFPGHGDTDKDSHKTLPTIKFDEQRLDDVEIFPYKNLISSGLSSVMVAHLNVPALESKQKYPSSLSKNIITNILKSKLKFKGLIFTDALDMKGVSNIATSNKIDLQAFLAGNDVLLMSKDVINGINEIYNALNNGIVTEKRLSVSVKKILQAKYKSGLNNYRPVETKNIISDLNRIEDDLLYSNLIENSQTVIRNNESIIPIKDLESENIAYISMGNKDDNVFYKTLQFYTKVEKIKINNINNVEEELKPYTTIIVGFHKSDLNPWKSYKFSINELNILEKISSNHKVILTIFTSPYSLNKINFFDKIDGILVAYQNNKISQKIAAQVIFGAISANGKLPISIPKSNFQHGDGFCTDEIGRLSYGIPESVDLSTKKLNKIDSIVDLAIRNKMTPGAQILVARRGKVIYNKNFGYHTYQKNRIVSFDNLYDVASLTKILVSLPLLMNLVESGKVSLDDSIGDLLFSYKDSNKSLITIREMLSHFARLKPWIPFYKYTLDSITLRQNSDFFSPKKTESYPIQISERTFLRADFKDTISDKIIKSPLLNKKKYLYSDLPYFIIKELIELHYGESLDNLIKKYFFNSLGANYSTYSPLNLFDKNQIVPTEVDEYFRFETVHGYVHDMGAAMQNGVGGHAGLFTNANDVAKIMQMFLQNGFYGGQQYIKPETIDIFNKSYYIKHGNRRGVGFDKPQLGIKGPTCGCISMDSFGHSGFTGTTTWADPSEDIIYVFLSNRTYPDSNNNMLLKENIRTEIQRLIYKAIID